MTATDADSRKRLFVGTMLSNEQQELLGTLKTDKLAEVWQRKIRFVKADKLHMTWVFFGDVAEEAIDDIKHSLQLSLAKTKSFSVIYNQIEFFQAGHQPRSLVLTPEIITDDLANAATNIRTATESFAAKHNHHQHFRPHITLLRIEAGAHAHAVTSRNSTTGLELPSWWQIQDALPIKLNVDNVCLIESHLDHGAYRVIERFELPSR